MQAAPIVDEELALMVSVFIDQRLSDAERRKALYEGDLFVYSPTRASTKLVALARGMIEEAFAPHDPRSVDLHLDVEACAAIHFTSEMALTR